jgi:type I restriction-modification system DNA methylase subunit
MPKEYKCPDCNKIFDQKSHYETHRDKKVPCILKDKPLSQVIDEKIEEKLNSIKKNNKDKKDKPVSKKTNKKTNKKQDTDIDYSYLRLPINEVLFELTDNDNKKKTESKSNILKMIDKAHNILYNAENIEGEDALNDIMNLIFIKSIQPIISSTNEDGKIDLLNKNYYNKLYDDDQLDEIFSYFEDLKNLSQSELDVIRNLNEETDAIRQMGDILKTHPITRMIYSENNFLKTKKAPTLQLLLNEVINKINIKELEMNEDVIGEIYEHIINGYVKKGSKLGQFFTPRKLMKLLLHYKKDNINNIISKINKKDKIKLYDSCMGTGGWVVIGYNMLKDKFADRLLLSGGEVKPSTFQYGLMNLILTLKKFPHDVRCESSLTHINNNKHHFVFTNPPFQTDKKFDQVKANFNSDKYTKDNKIKIDDIYHLKDNNPPIQFLELDLYKLENNGMCIIVLPYGELFFGSSYADNRRHFMKETNITDIILFEGGTFTHTGIKTCALIFQKDKSGTKEINFIQANKDCNKLTKITTITMDDINKELYSSWYLRDYLKDEYIENLCKKMTNFEWVEFKDIFTLEKGQIQSSKVEEECYDEDAIIFVTGAKDENFKKIKKQSVSYVNGENIFISPNGNGNKRPIKYFNGECNYSDLMALLHLDEKYTNKINKKYIYYFLKNLQTHIEEYYQKGSCNQSLDIKNFNRIKIPIPLLEEQAFIIQSVMELEDCKIKIEQGIEANNKMRIMYMEAMIKGASNKSINVIKTIGEVSVIKYGDRITKDNDGNENGQYPVYGGGGITFHTDNYNRDGKTCKISRFGMSEKNCVLFINGKYYLNDSGFTISSNTKSLMDIYLWNYLLLIKTSIFNTGSELAQRNIKIDKFNNIKIPVPPIEYQKKMEIVLNNCDGIDYNLNNMLKENEEYIKTAFLNSLDDYGNPNGFNIQKEVQLYLEEEVQLYLEEEPNNIKQNKKKVKSKKHEIIDD